MLLAIVACVLMERRGVAEKTPVPASRLKLVVGRETTYIAEPLTEHGYPDYLAALNRAAGRKVARDDNFWVRLLEVTGRAPDFGDEFADAVTEQLQLRLPDQLQIRALHEVAGVEGEEAGELYRKLSWAMSHPWDRGHALAIDQWLDEHKVVMEGIEAAARRPQAYCPLVGLHPPYLLNVRLPHVNQCRLCSWLFLSRAMRRVKAARMQEAFDDLLTVYRIAGHIERGALLTERVSGIHHRKAAHAGLGCWLAHCRLSEKELRERWAELSPLLVKPEVDEMVAYSRFEFLDAVMAIPSRAASFEDLGLEPEPTPVPRGAWGRKFYQTLLRAALRRLMNRMYTPRDINVVLRYGNERFDEIAAAMALRKAGERAKRCAAVAESIQQDRERLQNPLVVLRMFFFAPRSQSDLLPARILTYVLTPSLLEVEQHLSEDDARSACANAAFLLQMDIASRGPATRPLEERIRSDRFPKDPYTEMPLKIRKEERGIVIYSVGANGMDDSADDEDIEADDIRFTLGVEED